MTADEIDRLRSQARDLERFLVDVPPHGGNSRADLEQQLADVRAKLRRLESPRG